jgi:hypothetical protein
MIDIVHHLNCEFYRYNKNTRQLIKINISNKDLHNNEKSNSIS